VSAITDILVDYLNIYVRYPADSFSSKTSRKARHYELMNWAKQEYQSTPNIDEIISFMRTNSTLKYEQPFFLKVVTPCVQKDINEGRIESLRFLFECNGMNNHRIGTTIDYVNIFCLGTDYQYNAWDLADMVLSIEPDNQTVMYYKYISILHFLDYSIHEVPMGVLSGIDSAEKEHMSGMNRNLREFITLSKKLGKNDENFILKCTIIYAAWEQYLDNTQKYYSFEDYLVKHNLTYR